MRFQSIFSWFFITFFSIIWMAGCSTSLQKKLGDLNLIKDDYRFGDLYRMCHLGVFKDLKIKCQNKQTKSLDKNLIIIGDSFLQDETKESFITDSLHFSHWTNKTEVFNSFEHKPILLIECIERHVRTRLSEKIKQEEGIVTSLRQIKPEWLLPSVEKTEIKLEQILFPTEFILKFRELKAKFNQKVFGRIENEVVLSNDGSQLLFSEETDSTLSTSSFCKIENHEIINIQANLEKEALKFKKMGFERIIIGIIPNKTSIVAPDYGQYNHLAQRVENYSPTNFEFINIYEDFSKIPLQVYRKGDTHWNCYGKSIWLNKLNKMLSNDTKKTTNSLVFQQK